VGGENMSWFKLFSDSDYKERSVIHNADDAIISIIQQEFYMLFKLTITFNGDQRVSFYSADRRDFFLPGEDFVFNNMIEGKTYNQLLNEALGINMDSAKHILSETHFRSWARGDDK
jgi:hypothetical protein